MDGRIPHYVRGKGRPPYFENNEHVILNGKWRLVSIIKLAEVLGRSRTTEINCKGVLSPKHSSKLTDLIIESSASKSRTSLSAAMKKIRAESLRTASWTLQKIGTFQNRIAKLVVLMTPAEFEIDRHNQNIPKSITANHVWHYRAEIRPGGTFRINSTSAFPGRVFYILQRIRFFVDKQIRQVLFHRRAISRRTLLEA